jgi:sugar O-acyltransferase (sialic acid O-acetyltransferase NeuD family)
MRSFWKRELLIFQVVLDKKNVFIFGYSGHSYVIIESLMEMGYFVKGYFDLLEASNNPYSLNYLGSENDVDVKSLIKNDLVFPTVGENKLRNNLIQFFYKMNLNQFVAIDKSANISNSASFGYSTYVGKNSVINAQAKIGNGVIINTNSIVEHECEIADFVHIAPSAVLAGNVKVGKGSFIGANSVCKQNLQLGINSILGAGSVLLKNLPDNEIWAGNPAKKLCR